MALFPACGRHSTPPGRTTERLAGRQQHRVRHRAACRQQAQEQSTGAHDGVHPGELLEQRDEDRRRGLLGVGGGEEGAEGAQRAAGAHLAQVAEDLLELGVDVVGSPACPPAPACHGSSTCQGWGLGPGPGNPETRDAALRRMPGSTGAKSGVMHACGRMPGLWPERAHLAGQLGCWRPYPVEDGVGGVRQEEAAQAKERRRRHGQPQGDPPSGVEALRPCSQHRSAGLRPQGSRRAAEALAGGRIAHRSSPGRPRRCRSWSPSETAARRES